MTKLYLVWKLQKRKNKIDSILAGDDVRELWKPKESKKNQNALRFLVSLSYSWPRLIRYRSLTLINSTLVKFKKFAKSVYERVQFQGQFLKAEFNLKTKIFYEVVK